MAPARLPIPGKPLPNPLHHAAGQIGILDLPQNEKAGVVGDEGPPLAALPGGPTNQSRIPKLMPDEVRRMGSARRWRAVSGGSPNPSFHQLFPLEKGGESLSRKGATLDERRRSRAACAPVSPFRNSGQLVARLDLARAPSNWTAPAMGRDRPRPNKAVHPPVDGCGDSDALHLKAWHCLRSWGVMSRTLTPSNTCCPEGAERPNFGLAIAQAYRTGLCLPHTKQLHPCLQSSPSQAGRAITQDSPVSC